MAAFLERGERYNLEIGELVPGCRAVLEALDESVDPRAPVLGEEAVAHESGLHTAAMLDEPATFEPFDPATFGGSRRLGFGEETGRGAARRLLERVGREPTAELVAAFVEYFQERGPMDEDAATAAGREVRPG